MSNNLHEVTKDGTTVASRRGLLRGAGLATAAALLGTDVIRPAEAKEAEDDGVVPAPVYFPTRYEPEVKTPHPNVIAGVPTGPLAAAGQLPLILAAQQKEMKNSAMPWKCGDA